MGWKMGVTIFKPEWIQVNIYLLDTCNILNFLYSQLFFLNYTYVRCVSRIKQQNCQPAPLRYSHLCEEFQHPSVGPHLCWFGSLPVLWSAFIFGICKHKESTVHYLSSTRSKGMWILDLHLYDSKWTLTLLRIFVMKLISCLQIN